MKYLTILLSLLSLNACSTSPIAHEAPSDLGLTKSAQGPYVEVSKPGILKQYQAFYLNPIHFYSNDDRGRLISAEEREIDQLAASFKEKLVRKLGSRYSFFNQPARGVAIIDIQVMDVWSGRTLEALRPGLILPNNLGGGATMQAHIYDSVTKKKIATIWDSRSGKRTGYFSGLGKWNGTEAAFDEWAVLLSKSTRSSVY